MLNLGGDPSCYISWRSVHVCGLQESTPTFTENSLPPGTFTGNFIKVAFWPVVPYDLPSCLCHEPFNHVGRLVFRIFSR